jgi:hypothetical protein
MKAITSIPIGGHMSEFNKEGSNGQVQGKVQYMKDTAGEEQTAE